MDNTITDPNDPRYHYPVRSDVFPSNQDLKQKEDAYNKYAHNLHEKLLNDVHRNEENYDCFRRPEQEKIIDPIFTSSKKFVDSDRKLRKKVGGPTIRQTKFHPSYWKVWNKERDLLEQMSRDEILKEMRSSQRTAGITVMNSSERDVHIHEQSVPHNKRPPSSSGKTKPKKKLLNPPKCCPFDGSKSMDDHFEKFETFDSHLMNDISVKSLFDMTVKHSTVVTNEGIQSKSTPLVSIDLSYIADPNAIGKATIKGGGISKANKLPRTENTITSRCDVPPLQSTRAVKGGSFPSAGRLGNATVKVAAPGGQALLPLPKSTTDIKFSQSERFKSTSQLSAEAVHAPPGPGNYDVSKKLL
jgi:hypothetical protein